jgi:hypothetical protein
LQPYWGKLTVRNDRGDRGNVGIIRSPIRASILPDPGKTTVRNRIACRRIEHRDICRFHSATAFADRCIGEIT